MNKNFCNSKVGEHFLPILFEIKTTKGKDEGKAAAPNFSNE